MNHAAFAALHIDALITGARLVSETEYASKMDELDRLLNDPDSPMDPSKVWSLLAEVSQAETAGTNPPNS
jgi:hypothetical protein